MLNTYNIYWSSVARQDYEQVLMYLSINWSNKELAKFTAKAFKNLSNINRNPEMFLLINSDSNIHKYVTSKHQSIYYQISNNDVYILRLFDNRQAPNKLKL